MSEERGGGGVQGGAPSSTSTVPGVPSNFNPILFQNYAGGVNTLVSRVAIRDNQTSWCDGFYPLGEDSVRIIPDAGPAIFTTAGPGIVWFGFANIFTNFYAIILFNDGSVSALQKDTRAVTPLLPPGTITNASVNARTFRISQWSNLYILMVSAQTNGYWIWDMTNVYTAGTVGPIVTITDPGTDPSLSQLVYIGLPGAGGITPVATGAVQFDSSGNVTGVVITGLVGSPISQDGAPYLIVAFGPSGGGYSSAFGFCGVSDGVITSATLTNGGSGYTTVPSVSVSDPTGTGAVIVVSGASGGILTSLMVVSGGSGYTNPVVSITGGGGSNAAATVTVSNGVLQGATPISVGNGYTGNPTVSFISASGSGAVGVPLVVNGQVVAVRLTSGGTGYANPTYYTMLDGDGPAAASVQAMPFGVSGTAIEVYKSRVWISNGRSFVAGFGIAQAQGRTIFSAADSPVDFGDDGGVFLANDSFTRIGYTNLIQDNGFLWLIGDNCLNYISNVTTSTTGTPPVTTALFSNINADPQIGSLWPSSVQLLGRTIVYANAMGIYVADGGAVRKISEAFDGVYRTISSFSNHAEIDQPACVVDIFGRRTYCLLYQIVDPFSSHPSVILLCWDGRRCFTTRQTPNLVFVDSLSQFSQEYAYGTDGSSIYPLFTTPSNTFTKILQSKLYANPAYWVTKVENELHGVFTSYINDAEPLVVSIDTEAGLGTGNAVVELLPVAAAIFVNNSGQPVQFVNTGEAVVPFGAKGYAVAGPVPIGNNGRLAGLTITTAASDIEINSIMIQARNETLNV